MLTLKKKKKSINTNYQIFYKQEWWRKGEIAYKT